MKLFSLTCNRQIQLIHTSTVKLWNNSGLFFQSKEFSPDIPLKGYFIHEQRETGRAFLALYIWVFNIASKQHLDLEWKILEHSDKKSCQQTIFILKGILCVLIMGILCALIMWVFSGQLYNYLFSYLLVHCVPGTRGIHFYLWIWKIEQD